MNPFSAYLSRMETLMTSYDREEMLVDARGRGSRKSRVENVTLCPVGTTLFANGVGMELDRMRVFVQTVIGTW